MLRFPPQADIRLQNAPLAEVICQVRFPTILRIASEEYPVDFQDQVRGDFPQLEVEQIMLQMTVLGTIPPQGQPAPRIFRFKSVDGKTAISLALDFYAVSTTAYSHWQDFLGFLDSANQAVGVYQIPYATRIGLRYINHLTLQNTGASSVAEIWDILRPEMTALLRVDCWDEPLEMLSQLLVPGEEGDERLTLRSGFKMQEKPVFQLDLDCYLEASTALQSVLPLCEHFHDVIYNTFRWCIREERLAVFQPISAPEREA